MGTQKGEHAHARITVYDAKRQVVTIPDNIGRTDVSTLEGKQSFCYDALHTHHADGKLHVQVSDENDTTLGRFLGKWRPELLKARIFVNGRRVRDPGRFKVQPKMDIRIFMRP